MLPKGKIKSQEKQQTQNYDSTPPSISTYWHPTWLVWMFLIKISQLPITEDVTTGDT